MTSSELNVADLAQLASSGERAEVARAHELAVRGMRDEPRLQLVAAMAYDRMRVLSGRLQKFGTQAIADRGGLRPWPIDPATTDTERAKWGVGTLRQLTSRLIESPLVSKSMLRSLLRQRRVALPEDQRREAAQALQARGLVELGQRTAGAVVAAYWPVGSELDPRPLARALRAEGGARLALPAVVGEDLLFGAWLDDAGLQPAGYGTLGPDPGAGELRPDVVLTPLVGCDRRGGRLGQGKGYYDRALMHLEDAFVVGVAFDCQVLPAVPTEAHDRRLDAVLTDREWIALSR